LCYGSGIGGENPIRILNFKYIFLHLHHNVS
jgi:hypothetical protein